MNSVTRIKLNSRRQFNLLFLALFFYIASASTAMAEIKLVWDGLKNPGVRAALFDSYQGRHFSAITRLLAEQKLGRVKRNYERASLVLGGLYLSYGFHHEAANIFANLLEKNQPQEVSDRAWFYLAKTQYHRGLNLDALQALQQIKGSLPVILQEERQVLHAIILINQGEYEQAKTILRSVKNRTNWYQYGRYNLGVALYHMGNKEDGIAILNDIGSMGTTDNEIQNLKDKANIVLAYGFLDKQDPDSAAKFLNKMKLKGRHANEALLGLGRAYSSQNNHKKSLVPWLTLIERNPSDPAVQDALMAVPYAFGQLKAFKQSLEYYQIAMQHFQEEIDKINEAAEAISGGKLIEGLIRTQSGESIGGLWTVKNVLNTPEGAYLWHIMAGNEFRETLFNYTQLRLSLGKLEGWSASIDTLKNLSEKRRIAYQQRIVQLQSKVLLTSERVHHLLQNMAYVELERRKKRLVGYFNEARFSVAQIYDYAAKRWGG